VKRLKRGPGTKHIHSKANGTGSKKIMSDHAPIVAGNTHY